MEWTKKQVDDYEKMFGDYDNSFVIEIFKENVNVKSTVLELGCGTGLDYLSLKDLYEVTPTDYSMEFVKRFNDMYGEVAIQMNALTIEINSTFDCIYSNKVLNIFDDADLQQSFDKQYNTLNEHGLIFHTLWNFEEEFISTTHYCNSINILKLKKVLRGKFSIEKIITYTEMDQDDSLILIAKKI